MPRSPAGAGISGEIKWNFTTFLVDRNGNVVQRFEPEVTPDSKEVISAIEKQLRQYPSAIVPTGHSAGKSASSGWKLQFPKSRLELSRFAADAFASCGADGRGDLS